MFRTIKTLAVGLLICLCGTEARAQFGWGWGGWGGWSTTFQGDVARGLGVFAYGAGLYNLDTAAAASINTDTWMRWNNYWYLSQQEATRLYYQNKYKNILRNKTAYQELMKRIQNAPTSKDIEDGDALNAVLDQLSNPRIQSSALRSATTEIPAHVIQRIPFRNNSKAITIMLSELKSASRWPAVLDTERFALDKHEFENIVDQGRREDEAGQISQETLARARALVADMRLKLESEPLADSADQLRAMKFLKAVAGLTRLLSVDDTRGVLNELRKVKTTSVGHLLGFMHACNLRFGPATTPAERMIYRQLYSVLDETRDKLMETTRVEEPKPASAGTEHASDFFSSMNMDQLQGKKKATPQPTKPRQ